MLGAVEPKQLEAYRIRNRSRALQSYKAMTSMMTTNSLVRIKDHPPYSKDLEESVLLNSLARAVLDDKSGSYSFPKKLPVKAKLDLANAEAAAKSMAKTVGSVGVGVDHGVLCP